MSVGLFVVLVLLVCVLMCVALVIASFGYGAFFGAPFVGTDTRRARAVLARISFSSEDVVVDIGSGTGTFLIEAVKTFGAGKAIGYEVNPFLVWISRVRIFFAGLSDRIEVKRVNVFSQPLPECSVLVLYVLPGMMAKLEEKIVRERFVGTCLARGFSFPTVAPARSWKDEDGSVFLYEFFA